MAARPHVDSSVGERRLRPIYDWLDNGNNKKALQEAEKVLKKQPNFLCAKVLKALALLRLGKEDECEQLLEAVRAEVPADDSTLQAMTICYREVHRPEKICDIYDAAVRKEPKNEDLLTHLFMAYVRVADYKKQQQTALQLYRLKPKNPYYFWAVMSVVMQAYKAEDKLAQGVVLPLAERMVKKFVTEGRIEAEQEVQLYLMILEMQAKYEEALQVVEGPLGEKLVSYVYVPLKRASLLMKLERWRETNVLLKLLLREDMDRWSYITDYLATALKLFDSGQQQNGNNNNVKSGGDTEVTATATAATADSNGLNNNCGGDGAKGDPANEDSGLWREPDTSPAACCRFLDLLAAAGERQTRRLRGPHLARLELLRLLAERGLEAPPHLGELSELLMGYVRLFAEKPCCVSDLRRFLALLPAPQHPAFLREVADISGLELGEVPANVRQMQRHVCSLQLARTLGEQMELSDEHRHALVVELLRCYQSCAHFSLDTLQTEFMSNDPYALLAAHVLYDAWMQTGSSAPLCRAAEVLELALARSPANFHAKLLLLRLYSLLGSGLAAQHVYEALDIKHMQLDSLGYLHCAHIVASGHLGIATALYEATLKFFTANYKDSVDHLTFSYKFGSFLKIEEFVEFRERLNNSLHYALSTVERMLLELLSCSGHAQTCQVVAGMEVQPERDTVAWDSLQDNRDTTIMLHWDPFCRQLSPEQVQQTFADEVQMLRLRSLLLRALAAAVQLGQAAPGSCVANGGDSGSSSGSTEAEAQLAAMLAALQQQIQQELEKARARHVPCTMREPVSAPLVSRLHGYVASGALVPVLELLQLVTQLSQLPPEADGPARTAVQQQAAAAVQAAQHCVADVVTHIRGLASCPDPLGQRRAVLAHTVAVAEMLGQAALLCGVAQALLRPLQAPVVRRGKKKKEAVCTAAPVQPARWLLDAFNESVSALQGAALQLDDTLSHWDLEPPLRVGPDPAASKLAQRLSELRLGACEAAAAAAATGLGGEAACSAVAGWLTDSLQGALRELRQLIKGKAQYLASVQL